MASFDQSFYDEFEKLAWNTEAALYGPTGAPEGERIKAHLAGAGGGLLGAGAGLAGSIPFMASASKGKLDPRAATAGAIAAMILGGGLGTFLGRGLASSPPRKPSAYPQLQYPQQQANA